MNSNNIQFAQCLGILNDFPFFKDNFQKQKRDLQILYKREFKFSKRIC